MTDNIVTINVSETNPPIPSKLLRTGAFVSAGGTTQTAGSYTNITSVTDLEAILNGGVAIASLEYDSGIVTVTTATPHGLTINEGLNVIISGVTPSGYNGLVGATPTGANTLTYGVPSDYGDATVMGSVLSNSAAELTQMATTFFAQGSGVSVYVLELGWAERDTTCSNLQAWIAANPAVFFSYLVPRSFVESPIGLNLAKVYSTPAGLTKFFGSVNSGNYQAVTATSLSAALITCEADSVVSARATQNGEFTAAIPFYDTLNYNPSSTNKVNPLCFTFAYGATPIPTKGNSVFIAALKAGNINYIKPAAEGGLTENMLVWGKMNDGKPFNYYYTIAWTYINVGLDLANEIINGSNSKTNPLYYDQDGVNRLQNRAAKTLRSGVSYGMILGKVVTTTLTQDDFNANLNDDEYTGSAVLNAIPFADYVDDNESDYQDGVYDGLTASITPMRGFESITFNLNVTNFA